MDNRLSLQSRIGQVRKINKPIITAYFSGSNDIKNHSSESHQVIIDMCINYMQSYHISISLVFTVEERNFFKGRRVL